MQAHSEFPFLWFSAEVSWVQCHSFINPPVHRVQIDLQGKHAVKKVDEFGKIPRATAEKGDRLLLVGDDGLYFLYIPNLVLGHPGSRPVYPFLEPSVDPYPDRLDTPILGHHEWPGSRAAA